MGGRGGMGGGGGQQTVCWLMDRCERYQSDTSHCELPGSVPAESAQSPQLPCEMPHLRVRRWSRVASTTPATSQPRSSMNVPDIPI